MTSSTAAMATSSRSSSRSRAEEHPHVGGAGAQRVGRLDQPQWGNGPRPPNSGNWWLGRTGSTPGTSTEAASMSAGGGLDWAYVINTRDFPPQTPLPLPSLATTIGNIIAATPSL